MAISSRCTKYLLLSYIIVYALSGFALLVLASINLAQIYAFRQMLHISVVQCNWIVAGMGAAAVVTAILGWQGAVKEHALLLKGFVFLLIAVILVQLSIAVWCLVVRSTFGEGVPKAVEKAFSLYDKEKAESVDLWNEIQKRLRCCGVDGPSDWRGQSQIPWSCCATDGDNPHEGVCQRIYQRGCVIPLVDYTAVRLAQTSAYALAASLVQGGAAFLACFYLNAIKNDKRRINV